MLRVGVSYRDRRSPGPALDKYAEVRLAVPVQANVPQVPRNPQATPLGASSIQLTWDAPAGDGGAAIEHYAYRQQTGTGRWSEWSEPLTGGGSARSYTPYRDKVLACWSVRPYKAIFWKDMRRWLIESKEAHHDETVCRCLIGKHRCV